MKISAGTSERLCGATFVCALLVVHIHCQSLIPWMHGDSVGFGLPLCSFKVPVKVDVAVRIFLTDTLSRVAVPFFFTLSGFFIANSRQSWIEQIKKRFVTLYVPFVIWNALNTVLNIAVGKWSGLTVIDILSRVFGWNPMVRLGCMQFWYLQAIFVFLLVWPIVRLVMSNRFSAFVLIVVLFSGWMHVYHYWLGMAMGPGNYLWLCIGASLALHGGRLIEIDVNVVTRWFAAIVFGLSVAAKVLAGVARCQAAYDIADYVLIASGLMTIFLNLPLFGLVSRTCRKVTGLSFFVFAFHTIGITIAIQLGKRLMFDGLGLYLFKIGFAVSLSLAVGVAFRKWLPKAFGVVTGGRM